MSMTPLEWLDALQGSGIRPGLRRMRAILHELGNPHRKVPAVIVAGTNGKGSTSATLTSILTTAGYRVAHYTSPHLIDLRERWTIGGEMIDPATLDGAIEAIHAAGDRAGIIPTYFEALTLIAFVVFAQARCDVSILEVGMGGRLDATNVVRPIAALITPVAFDHMEYLGNTLRQIAAEKAGVIHRGAIVLTSSRDPVVTEVIRSRAKKFGIDVTVASGDDLPKSLEIPLAGAFQRDNVALAVRAAKELRRHFSRIDDEAIRQGVASTRWRGRLERLRLGSRQIWIDGCHNPHAIAAVLPFVETLRRPRLLVFGVMSDKPVDQMTGALFPLFDRIITTEPYPPRSADADSLAQRALDLGIRVEADPSPGGAFQRALDSGIATIFIGGSLYLAGEALAFFESLPLQTSER
ncbi:MAG TPA: folylpolyglutamate synthase/dihydrofolate synthase family protein [Thermoanaerobaculia bacterium]